MESILHLIFFKERNMQTEFFKEQDYIDAIALPAQNACKKYGYLPSVLIAQSCLQNGYGIRSYWDNPQI